jgi:hypothetical protein
MERHADSVPRGATPRSRCQEVKKIVPTPAGYERSQVGVGPAPTAETSRRTIGPAIDDRLAVVRMNPCATIADRVAHHAELSSAADLVARVQDRTPTRS